MEKAEDGAANAQVGGAGLSVVVFTRRMVMDELPVFVHLLAEAGDFFLQRFDFGFSVHKF
jgi:hypothetical protein